MRRELDEIYYKSGWLFPAAVSYLMDIGFQTAKQLTDEQIASVKGNAMMTDEFTQGIMTTAREIAKVCNGDPVKLIMYCQLKELFDPEFID